LEQHQRRNGDSTKQIADKVAEGIAEGIAEGT
jgi:hypothetical protein